MGELPILTSTKEDSEEKLGRLFFSFAKSDDHLGFIPQNKSRNSVLNISLSLQAPSEGFSS